MGWIILTILAIMVVIPSVGYALYQGATWGARVEAWEARGSDSYNEPKNYALVGWAGPLANSGDVSHAMIWLSFAKSIVGRSGPPEKRFANV